MVGVTPAPESVPFLETGLGSRTLRGPTLPIFARQSANNLASGIERGARRQLRLWQKRLAERGVTLETRCEQGIPVPIILANAKQHAAQYIAIGSHGHTAFHDLVFGGVASGVVKRGVCPVIVASCRPHATGRNVRRARRVELDKRENAAAILRSEHSSTQGSSRIPQQWKQPPWNWWLAAREFSFHPNVLRLRLGRGRQISVRIVHVRDDFLSGSRSRQSTTDFTLRQLTEPEDSNEKKMKHGWVFLIV